MHRSLAHSILMTVLATVSLADATGFALASGVRVSHLRPMMQSGSSQSPIVTSVQFPQYYNHSATHAMSYNNASGGVVAEQNWNVEDTDTGTSPSSNLSGLVDENGSTTTLGFSYSGYTTNDGTNNSSFPAAIWYQSGGLCNGYLAAGSTFNQNGAPETLLVTGLNATHTYNLIVYVTSPWWFNGGTTSASVSLGGTSYYIATSNTLGSWIQATSTSSGTPTVGNYVEFSNLTGSVSETVTIAGAYAGVAAFQVVDESSTGSNVPATYPLTVINGSGSGNYVAGAAVTVTANAAASGYTFAGWTGSTSVLSNPSAATTTLAMPAAAVSIAAAYAASGSSDPAGSALQVTVLQASQAVTVAPPGAIVNIGANFNVASALSANYLLNLYLVDQNGNTVAEIQNNLNNGLTILPSTEWLGPLSVTSSIVVPQVANGNYSIMLGLYNSVGAVQLTPGQGVTRDDQYRYLIGTVDVSSAATAPSYLAPVTLDLTGYHLTFDDEFASLSVSDSTIYNGSNWYTDNEQCCLQSSDGSGTAMVGLSSPHNPFSLVSGGGLDIRLQEVNGLWTSGVLTSVDNSGVGFSQQYGYFEMKAKFPTGLNTMPALWLLNTAAKSNGAPAGEIDVVEYISNPGFPNYMATTLHNWSNSSTPAMSHNLVSLPTDGFHTYGMLWTPTTTTFYFDGTVTFQIPTPAIMQQPYYLIVDLGLGGGWPTNNTPSVNDLEIQYVRVYSK